MGSAEQFWNDLAEGYAKKPVPDPEAFRRKLEITKSRLAPQEVVLDVGCGTGSLALELAPHARHVHGADLAAQMVSIANGKAAQQGVQNVTFHTRSLAELEAFDAHSFDMVCAFNIFHLVKDRAGGLQAMFKLLKPGGLFVTSTPCLGESAMPMGLILPVMRWLGKAPPVEVFRLEQFEQQVLSAGFVNISRPQVGAGKMTYFAVAEKPGAGA